MAKYKIYSVFIDLNPGDDHQEIPIIHTQVASTSKEDAIKLALCSLASTLRGNKAKVIVTLVSNWKPRKIQCEIKPHKNNGECVVRYPRAGVKQ